MSAGLAVALGVGVAIGLGLTGRPGRTTRREPAREQPAALRRPRLILRAVRRLLPRVRRRPRVRQRLMIQVPTSEPSAPEDSQGDIKTGSSDESSKEKTAKSARSIGRAVAPLLRVAAAQQKLNQNREIRRELLDRMRRNPQNPRSRPRPRKPGRRPFATGSSSTDELASLKAAARGRRAGGRRGGACAGNGDEVGGCGDFGGVVTDRRRREHRADSPLTWVVAAAARREIGVSDADSVASVCRTGVHQEAR